MNWYAVYTKPRAEKKLAAALKKLGIEHYLPLLRKRKKWSDRYKWVEEPVFASYLFVRIDLEHDRLRVLKLPHAVYLVSNAGTPTPIDENGITLLRLAVENFAGSLIVRDTSQITAGESVQIIDGPFAGKEAIVERVHNKAMVVVAFPALNKSVQVEIPVTHLTKAGQIVALQ